MKPIAKDKMDKAGRLASDIAKQPGLTDTHSLATKVGQQISSVGGSQSDVGLMTGLVQAQLANQGIEVKEDFAATAPHAARLDTEEMMEAFETMMSSCDFHPTQADTIYRNLARDGVYERPLNRAQSLWTPEMWAKVHGQCQPEFDIRPDVEAGKIVIRMNA